MKVKDKSISAWQTAILMFTLLFANKVLMLPSLLYNGAKVEAFIIPIILSLFEFGLLFLFYKLKTKYPNESFFVILKTNFGKVIPVILYLFLMFFFLCKAAILYNITYVFFRKLIYKDSSNILFLFCFIPIVNYLAIVGLRVMGRTMQLFFPVILVIVLFCVIVGFFGINSQPIFFQASPQDFFITTLKHFASFGDTIFLFLIMDRVNIKPGKWKVVFCLSGISLVLVCLISIVFILSYTYVSFLHPFALFEIMNYVKEYGGLGRIDIISMVVIIMLTYFHLSIYLKGFVLSFKSVFSKIDDAYSFWTFNILMLLIINYVVLNLETTLYYGENFVSYISLISFVLVPFLVAILLFKKKRSVPR